MFIMGVKIIRSLFFMILMVMASTSVVWCNSQIAESVTPCDMGSVPFQFIYLNEQSVITVSEAETSDIPDGFPAFVKAVTGHLAVKLSQEKLCLDSIESREHSLLQFAAWVVDAGPRHLTSVPSLAKKPLGVCRITSPWADIVIERKPVPSVRAIFRYSERQLLTDQAVLAGAQNVPSGVAMPLSAEEFRRYANMEYVPSEIRNEPAERPIEERVPPDLLWLFRLADLADHQDHGYGFSGTADGYAGVAMKAGSETYTKIVNRLIDRCFESDGADIHYDTINDVADLISLEEYKITTLIDPLLEHFSY